MWWRWYATFWTGQKSGPTSSWRHRRFFAPYAPAELPRSARMLASAGWPAEACWLLRVNWHADVWPETALVDLLRPDFSLNRIVRPQDMHYAFLEAQYGKPSQVAAPEGYYLFAEPRKPPVRPQPQPAARAR